MKKHLVLALALAAAPFAASANELSYNYVEGGYAKVNVDETGADFDMDGGQIRGSVELGESFYLYGGYGRVSDEFSGVDVDLDETQIGVGYRMSVSEKADFIAELGYLRQTIDVEGFGEAFDADGGRVSAGFRGAFNEHFEGYVKASYTDGGDFDGDFSGTVGALVKFNPTWGIVGEVEAGDDITKYMVGVRASF